MKRTFRPAPKPKQTKDRRVLDYIVNRRDGTCLWGLFHPGMAGACSAGLDPHHIVHRGAGGGDTYENVITLCRMHHTAIHNGLIQDQDLYDILSRQYGYKY